MKNDLKDKDIAIEKDKIKEKLKKIDSYLIIPNSIKPENIDYRFKTKKNYAKPIIAAACLIIILFSTILFLNKKNPMISNDTVTYDKLKGIYLSFHNNSTENNNAFAANDEEKSLKQNVIGGMDGYLARGVSDTNIQVKGVDEGDIVKTDGDYIYSLSNYYYMDNVNGEKYFKSEYIINIVSTLRKGEIKKINTIKVKGQPLEMYLKDKTLVVISNIDPQYLDIKTNKILTGEEYNNIYEDMFNDSLITEEMRNDFLKRYQYQTLTSALIYDVNDAYNPKLLREFTQEGYYSSSRLIDNNLYMITNKNDYMIIYDKEEDINISNIVPFTDDSIDGGKRTSISAKDISVFNKPNNYSFTLISGLNIKNKEKAISKACLGGSDIVYSSLNSMYITSRYYENETNANANNKIAIDMIMPVNSDTDIIKYTFENGRPVFYASGRVPGNVLNQYSIDEYNGYLRIATTKGNTWDTTGDSISKNNIYVLDDKLNVIGKIEDLTPGEKIYSVRFMGEKGYIVTFRQVDPLFALDLSNPREPKVTGELKIPGFSSYLHPYSDNLLIGIGNDTETVTLDNINGEIVKTKGIKLSLFDVSNPNDPKEIKNFILGDMGTSSEVLYNPKALLFSKEKDILAFPVTLCEGQENNNTVSFIGYYVFKIDESSGFSINGRITHYDKLPDYNYSDEKSYYDNLGYDIKRGVYVDDVLYTVSDKTLMANSLSDFSLINKVDLR